jgi:nicotinate-nucleotide--dimethylbenzimidazole phosphoribosyltransferase
MTDTGRTPGERLPEHLGDGAGDAALPPHADALGVPQAPAPGWGAHTPADPSYGYADQPAAPGAGLDEDEEVLLMPGVQGTWSDPQPVPPQHEPVNGAVDAGQIPQGGPAFAPQAAPPVPMGLHLGGAEGPSGAGVPLQGPEAGAVQGVETLPGGGFGVPGGPSGAPLAADGTSGAAAGAPAGADGTSGGALGVPGAGFVPPAQAEGAAGFGVPQGAAAGFAAAVPGAGDGAPVQGQAPGGEPAGAAPGADGAPAAPRRPLQRGPQAPETPSGGVSVRSLADRGPAQSGPVPMPVRVQGPPTSGPEYLDVPRDDAHGIPAQQTGEPAEPAAWPDPQTPSQQSLIPQTDSVIPSQSQPEPILAFPPAEPAAPAQEAPAEPAAAAPVPPQGTEQPPAGPVAAPPAQPIGLDLAAAGPVAEQPPAEPAAPAEDALASATGNAANLAALVAAAGPAEAAVEPQAVEPPAVEPPAVEPQAAEPQAEASAEAAPAQEAGPAAAPRGRTAKRAAHAAAAPVPETAQAPSEADAAPAAEEAQKTQGGGRRRKAEPKAAEVQAEVPAPAAEPEPQPVDAAEPVEPAAEPAPAEAPEEPQAAEPDEPAVAPEPEPELEPEAAPVAAAAEAAGAAEVPAAEQAPGEPAEGYEPAVREAVHRVIRERRDIRNGFRPDPIPHDVLLRVLEAAHTAPSVGHSQPWDFVVIRSEKTRERMHELATAQREAYAESLPKGRARQFRELKIEAILDTPVNIVVTADPTRGGRHTLGRHTQPQMAPYSSALAVENLWLAARAEGLGVGWVSFFDEREMVAELGLPEHLEVVAYLCVGYVDEFPEEPELMQAGWSQRRPLSWVVHEEEYGNRVLPGEEPHDLLEETLRGIRPLDAKALGEAWERQKRMTKPAGALGMLEIISAQLSGLSRQCPPPIPEPAAVAVFAGDHGVHAQGVTAWPQEVTGQMVANFLGGGAVCNAFANQVGAEVCVIDVGVAGELPATPGLLPRKVRAGTADFTAGPAMTRDEALRAIEVGIETARDLVAAGNKALLTGEMGIANTTVSAAIIAVYTGTDPAEVTGRGTGINDEMHARKVDVVRRALELHRPDPADPIAVLTAIGGLEHAAMVGLLLGAAALRTPVILDGVSAGAAALLARAIAPEVLAACIAGHRSAEPGHVAALTALGLRPLVDLDLRLGEGTGALLALPLVQSAARAMHEVATFDSAGVTEKA